MLLETWRVGKDIQEFIEESSWAEWWIGMGYMNGPSRQTPALECKASVRAATRLSIASMVHYSETRRPTHGFFSDLIS